MQSKNVFYLVIGLLVLFVFVGYVMNHKKSQKNSEPLAASTDDVVVAINDVEVADTEVVENDSQSNNQEHTVEGTYIVDTTESNLQWSASRIAGSPHVGIVSISGGQVAIRDGQFVDGQFTIDMTSIDEPNGSQRFVDHVKNDDFFSVATYPTAKLVLHSVDPREQDDQFLIRADLTIKDKTEPIEFLATIIEEGSSIRAKSNFTIDRTRWDITYDSGTIFQQLGDKAIKDEISFALDLVVRPE